MSPLDAGDIKVLGKIMKPNRIPNVSLKVGFMPQSISLHNEFNVGETLNYFGNLYQMKDKEVDERIKILETLLELPPKNALVRECSGGEQRRVSLAVSMLHKPALLILDEPTVGVDPLLREKIWNFIVDLTRTSNLAIIITTHYIEEAQRADRCGMMRNGVLLAEDSPSAIVERSSSEDLSEAFYKLCTKQGYVNEYDSEAHNDLRTDSVEMKSLPSKIADVPGNFDDKIERRKDFHFKTLKALIYKSFIQVFRTPM